LARAGREWVLENFSQEQQIKKTQQLYLDAFKTSRATKSSELTDVEKG
jgi:predicted metal-dependent HD superfamily phosphohydrolase